MANNTDISIPGFDGRLKSVGIIMDGNGRWAKKRGLPRNAGHKAGAKAIKRVVEAMHDIRVCHLTLYAFSTENWKRPKEEVDGIMDLIFDYLGQVKEIGDQYKTSVKFIGDKSRLPERLRKKCIEVENMSSSRENIINVALNYGGKDEVVRAVNEAIRDGVTEITEEEISRRLYTSESPDPDLIIRTGGEYRISNFMIWQSAYSELYVTDTLWPDFDKADVIAAATEFYSRKRRYGGLDPEDRGSENKQ